MGRDTDPRETRKALRKLRAAKARAEAGTGPELSDWEEEFLASLESRLEEYGSAFADPAKGAREAALSSLQQQKVREIDRKTRGKAPRGFGMRRKGEGTRRGPDAAPDAPEEAPGPPSPQDRRAAFRVIKGGEEE